MTKDVSREIAQLLDKKQKLTAQIDAEVEKLKAQKVDALREELKSARRKVKDLEKRIAVETGKVRTAGKRTRTSRVEMRERIFNVLSKNPDGLIPMEISKDSELNYVSVANFLKNHPKEIGFKRDGKRKRYFLK